MTKREIYLTPKLNLKIDLNTSRNWPKSWKQLVSIFDPFPLSLVNSGAIPKKRARAPLILVELILIFNFHAVRLSVFLHLLLKIKFAFIWVSRSCCQSYFTFVWVESLLFKFNFAYSFLRFASTIQTLIYTVILVDMARFFIVRVDSGVREMVNT